MKIFIYMLEIDILRNSSQNILGVLRGALEVFGCPKRHPDALLAKTMEQRTTNPSNAKATFVKSTRTQRFLKTI